MENICSKKNKRNQWRFGKLEASENIQRKRWAGVLILMGKCLISNINNSSVHNKNVKNFVYKQLNKDNLLLSIP